MAVGATSLIDHFPFHLKGVSPYAGLDIDGQASTVKGIGMNDALYLR
jgi:hypothetical protein